MNDNVIGLLISFAFVFAVLGAATLIARFTKGASENSRKFVHIIVGNWVFILLYFDQLWAAILVPFSFIIVNYLSTKYKIFKAMERDDESYGTVYYAISLTFLTLLGFLLKWPVLPFIGVLTMAYGDGFAAIVGKKWGKRKPFAFAQDKSIEGSLTVVFFSFLITALALYFFNGKQNMATQSLWTILAIAVLTGFFSAFIELTGKNGCDNLTLPIGSAVFATLLFQYGHLYLFLYMVFALAVLLLAYKAKAITVSGIATALLVALTLYSFIGPWVALALIAFFLLGSIASKIKNTSKIVAEQRQEKGGARTWKQVIANSFPALVLAWLFKFFPTQDYFILLSFAVFAAAAADTISSEIGMLSSQKAFHILTWKEFPKGLSGGVTLLGIFAGIMGSLLISLFVLIDYSFKELVFVFILGVLGTIIDSILGASLQRKYRNDSGDLVEEKTQSEKPTMGLKFISNNAVNFFTLNLVTIVGLVYYFIFI
jgi:uncharacterized protein (TIGR00297 family)